MMNANELQSIIELRNALNKTIYEATSFFKCGNLEIKPCTYGKYALYFTGRKFRPYDQSDLQSCNNAKLIESPLLEDIYECAVGLLNDLQALIDQIDRIKEVNE